MTLKEIQGLQNYNTDKESTHHYLDVYEKLLAPFKEKDVINLLEVGIATGGSLKLWEEYFDNALIWGVDIINEIKYEYGARVEIAFCDINEVTHSERDWDIAIDDGSHFVKDQLVFINLVWPSVRKGGLIIIEDVHDLENNKQYFDALKIPYEIIDLRKTGIHCSVLLIFKK